MLILNEKLTNLPILSLQTGTEIARITDAIVDPANLQILAYKLTGNLLSKVADSYIRTADIREYSPSGFIVDSSDEIIYLDDVVTKKDIYDLQFTPIGHKIIDEAGHKLGKVIGYTLNISTFTIFQLQVASTGIARLINTDVLIHRSQIKSIDNTTIIVEATTKKLKDVTPIINTEPIVNPFRSANPNPQKTIQSPLDSSDSAS